jgi:hypothetical protein
MDKAQATRGFIVNKRVDNGCAPQVCLKTRKIGITTILDQFWEASALTLQTKN